MFKKLWLKLCNFAYRLCKWKPKLVDISAKLLEANINNLNIELAKEKNIVIIEAIDNSKHVHFHNEIGLSPEIILSLSAEDVGNFIKHKTILTMKSAFKENPGEMNSYLTMYGSTAIATGASGVITQNLGTIMKTNTPYPSGDFVKELPAAINVIVSDEIKIEDEISIKIIEKTPRKED